MAKCIDLLDTSILMSTPKYTTSFTARASLYAVTSAEQNEVRASLDQMKSLLPADIDPTAEVDLLFIVGNLAVAGLVNLNDDAVSITDALAMYKGFERRQCNIEHNRKQIVGYILKAGLSEMGTNRLITEDEARAANVPFNIVTVAVIWKVANQDLANFILQSSAPGSPDKDALSLSFEVGFNDYSIVTLPPGTTEVAQASQTVTEASPSFLSYNTLLRINKGSGKTKDGQSVARLLVGSLVPLGQGVVTVPAAAVKGISAITEAPNPTPDPVYIPSTASTMSTSTAKANRVKIPAGLTEKAKALNYPKANVTLSDGRVLEGVTVFSGEELDLDAQLASLDGVVITDMTPFVPPQIDDSPVIHPHIDETFPVTDPAAQEQAAEQQRLADIGRNAPYTDAVKRYLEAAHRILTLMTEQTATAASGVSIIKTNPLSSQSFPSMKLEDLKQAEAKIKAATTPDQITEALASMSLITEAIMKASEEHAQAARNAAAAQSTAETTLAGIQTELAATKEKLQAIENAQAATAAEAAFQERMTIMASEIEVDDDSRAFIVEDVRACVDQAAFDKYLVKAKKTMKKKAAPFTKKSDDGKPAKDSADDKDADDKGKQAAKAALASAADNPVDRTDIDPLAQAATPSLMEQMQAAFASGTKIGGRTITQIAKTAEDIAAGQK